MTSSAPSHRYAVLLSLLVVPVAASAIVTSTDNIPDVLRGFVLGVCIALLLGFCYYSGAVIRGSRKQNDDRRLDDLDPLGGLPRDEDSRR